MATGGKLIKTVVCPRFPYSEFFREAVRAYFAMRATGPAQSGLVFPREGEEAVDDPFQGFAEWASEADSVYDQLG